MGSLPDYREFEELRRSRKLTGSDKQESITFSPHLMGLGSGSCPADNLVMQFSGASGMAEMFDKWREEELRNQRPALRKMEESLCSILSFSSRGEEYIRAHTLLLHPAQVVMMMKCGWVQQTGVFCREGAPFDCSLEKGCYEVMHDTADSKERGVVYCLTPEQKWIQWRHHGVSVESSEGRPGSAPQSPLVMMDMEEVARERLSSSASSVFSSPPVGTGKTHGESLEELANSGLSFEMDVGPESCPGTPVTPGPEDERGGYPIRTSASLDSLRLSRRMERGSPVDPRGENVSTFSHIGCEELVGQGNVPGHFYDCIMGRVLCARTTKEWFEEKEGKDFLGRLYEYHEKKMAIRHRKFLVERHTLHISRKEHRFRRMESTMALCKMLNVYFGVPIPSMASLGSCANFFKRLQSLAALQNVCIRKWELGTAGIFHKERGNREALDLNLSLMQYLKEARNLDNLCVVEGRTPADKERINQGNVLMFRYIYSPSNAEGKRAVWPGTVRRGREVYGEGPANSGFMLRLPTNTRIRCYGFSREGHLERLKAHFCNLRGQASALLRGELQTKISQGRIGGMMESRNGRALSLVQKNPYNYSVAGSIRRLGGSGQRGPWNVGVFSCAVPNLEFWIGPLSEVEQGWVFETGLSRLLRGVANWCKEEFGERMAEALRKEDSRFDHLYWMSALEYGKGGRIEARKMREQGVDGFLSLAKAGSGRHQKYDVMLAELASSDQGDRMICWRLTSKGLTLLGGDKQGRSSMVTMQEVLVLPYKVLYPLNLDGRYENSPIAEFGGAVFQFEKKEGKNFLMDYVSRGSSVERAEFVITERESTRLRAPGCNN